MGHGSRQKQSQILNKNPISVHVSARKVPIEAPGSVVFKRILASPSMVHVFSPASPLGQGVPPHVGRLRPLLVLCAELFLDGPYGQVKKVG